MSETENKNVARALLEEVVNKQALHRMPEFIAPEYVVHHTDIKGIDGAREHARAFVEMYPDLKVTIEGQVAEGDMVATWYTATGTHAGEWQGIKPTHRQLHLFGVNVQRIRDGRIVEHWGGSNSLEALLELGVVQLVRG